MSTASILARLRTELRDEGTPFTASVVANGTTTEFDLPAEFIDVPGSTIPFMVWKQTTTPTLLSLGNDYTVDEKLGVIITTEVFPAGTLLSVSGKHFRYFTDAQLLGFIATASLQHLHGQFPPVVLDQSDVVLGVNVLLNPVEEYLIVLLALVEALWVLATDSSEDIDVLTPDGVQIPRQQRYAMLMQLITAREAEYQKYAALLNVGLNRIEMFELRRVSRTTNRFVPVYRPQEYDDHATPQRIYPPIDTGITP